MSAKTIRSNLIRSLLLASLFWLAGCGDEKENQKQKLEVIESVFICYSFVAAWSWLRTRKALSGQGAADRRAA